MKLLTITLLAGLAAAANAQPGKPISNLANDGVAPPAANATVPGTLTKSDPARPIPDSAAGAHPLTSYTLALKWNDRQQNLTLDYPNTLKQPLTIQGVQASGNLYVVDYPRVIPPGGTAGILLTFLAQPNTQSDSDVVRLLTSDGIKLLRVVHARDAAFSLTAQQLNWQVGETATTKSVTLTLNYGISLTGARAMLGHTATIQSLGSGIYQISVTPRTTAKPGSFPVLLTFDQDIPGGAPIITCVISAN